MRARRLRVNAGNAAEKGDECRAMLLAPKLDGRILIEAIKSFNYLRLQV